MQEHSRFDYLGHAFVLCTVLFTVYGQLVLKWQMGLGGPLPEGAIEKLVFLLRQLLNPWIVTGFVAAFLASLAWMAAVSRLELSYAYPFMSLNFVLVLALSPLLFGEPVTVPKVVGIGLIIAGLLVSSRG